MIPVEAVEAASEALRPTMAALLPAFDDSDMQLVVALNHVARMTLEAAAPYMLADAYERGWEDGREGNRNHMPT